MKNLNELKAEIVGNEFTVIELSNLLVNYECEDICWFGNWEEILESGTVIVATEETGSEHIQIDFEVTCLSDKDLEAIEASTIKIKDVYNC